MWRKKKFIFHLILDVQRTHLLMEELQGVHVAVSGCVVDSVGTTLRLEEGGRGEERGGRGEEQGRRGERGGRGRRGRRRRGLSLTFSYGITQRLQQVFRVLLRLTRSFALLRQSAAKTSTLFWPTE